MIRQKVLLRNLLHAARVMMQGGLSETTRCWGNPNCACHRDPDRRHGPNLYITWREKGRSRSLYVPADRVPQARRAHAAWTEFWESAVLLAAGNREEFRRQGQKEKPKKEKSQPRRRHGSTTA